MVKELHKLRSFFKAVDMAVCGGPLDSQNISFGLFLTLRQFISPTVFRVF